MNENQKAAPATTGRFAAGMFLYGVAFALGIVSVLYRHIPVAELTDPVRVVGFTLFIGGWLLACRAPFQKPVV